MMAARTRVWMAMLCAVAVLAASAVPAGAQEPSGAVPGAGATPSAVVSEPGTTAPTLGEGFALSGRWVASGVVWLDWDDVDAASGYELMVRAAEGWVLLSEREPVEGVVAAFDGPSARVVGLFEGATEYWFAVRARNVSGVSAWSHSSVVEVPEHAQTGPPGEALL